MTVDVSDMPTRYSSSRNKSNGICSETAPPRGFEEYKGKRCATKATGNDHRYDFHAATDSPLLQCQGPQCCERIVEKRKSAKPRMNDLMSDDTQLSSRPESSYTVFLLSINSWSRIRFVKTNSQKQTCIFKKKNRLLFSLKLLVISLRSCEHARYQDKQ
jgi:hypothetical protein